MIEEIYNFYFLCIRYVNQGMRCSKAQKNISSSHLNPGPTCEVISIV